jgi:multisubunit Na+/H+ antiporter MnhB subunit
MTDLPGTPLMLMDVLLALAIVAVAHSALRTRDTFAMIVTFIVFGLLVALAWVRLRAPDVAMAEAAIGAGVTGALLLRTLRHIGGERRNPAPVPPLLTVAIAALSAFVAGVIGLAFLGAPQGEAGLTAQVAARMGESGVTHPVTAVLLNFRAYDTLLEVVVLFAAVMSVWAIDRSTSAAGPTHRPAPTPVFTPGIIHDGFVRVALPAMVLLAAHLVWIGAYAPGGAFQGGAVLGAVGLLVLLSRGYVPRAEHATAIRFLLILGVAVFTGIGLWVATPGGAEVLEYPQALAKTLILTIEATVTVSIAVTLAALFHGAAPGPAALTQPPIKGPTHDT